MRCGDEDGEDRIMNEMGKLYIFMLWLSIAKIVCCC